MEITIRQVDSLARVERSAWDRLDGHGNPFLRYDFLYGLERYRCLEGHGWQPCHLLATAGDTLLGAAPLYLKGNSHGEFVFDWTWAEAFERAGGRYYPKLVSAIPFTPVRGPRLLIDPAADQADVLKSLLLKAGTALAERARLSSFHCLFMEEGDLDVLTDNELLVRRTCQFRWHNRDYGNFEDFLQDLTSKQRKQIRRERRAVRDAGVEIMRLGGADATEEHWQVFHEFYCNTFYQRWGSPRLTLDFFHHLGATMPEHTLLILAKQGPDYVAGAFAMLGADTLYGRHWGCDRYLANLHFELCYYQTIEHCLERRLASVDAGVQGEHKLKRGFEPQLALSGHWLRHASLRRAVADFLQQETREMNAYVTTLTGHLPFKK